MRVNYQLLITYYMVALALGAVLLSGSMGAAMLTGILLATLASLYFNLRVKDKIRLPPWLWSLAAAGVVLLFGLDYMAGSSKIVVIASKFLTVLLALKLFDIKSERDHRIVYAIVFFQLLATATVTVSPLFFLLLALFVLGAINGMTVFNISRSIKEQAQEHTGGSKSDAEGTIPPGLFNIPFFLFIVTVSTLSLIVTLALFFIIPRVGTGLLNRTPSSSTASTGFTESVEPGIIGEIKGDSTVVMRVEINGERVGLGPLYFRGTALERFDGRRWTRGDKEQSLIPSAGQSLFKIPNEDEPHSGLDTGPVIEMSILLEPISTEVLFVASRAEMVSGQFKNLWTDSSGSGSLYLSSPPYRRIKYRVWSRLPLPVSRLTPLKGLYNRTTEEKIVAAEDVVNKEVIAITEADRRLKKLVDEIVEGKESKLEKAVALRQYLLAGYSYTLNPLKGDGLNPTDDFLFFTRQGYCEQFATSFALMLRAAGIGSRLVTGYLQGEWNGFGKYYIIRQSDAHSWVEADIDGYGWIQFDPTPPGGLVPVAKRSDIMLYIDMLRMKWNRYVINYTFEDQRSAALKFEGGTRGLGKWLKDIYEGSIKKRPSRLLLPLIILALTVAVLLLYLKRIKKGKRADLPFYYSEMLGILKSEGKVRDDSETPMEFALRIGRPGVIEITEAFQKERYGGKRLESGEQAKVKRSLSRLKMERGKGRAA